MGYNPNMIYPIKQVIIVTHLLSIDPNFGHPVMYLGTTNHEQPKTLGIQSYSQMMIGVYNHLLS